jgi:hypothetical protein
MKGKHHGMRNTRIYESWRTMKKMCYGTNHISYKTYGGRGITVCDEWKNSFEKFYEWSIENGYREGLKLVRKDVDRNYEPSNCEWREKRQVVRTGKHNWHTTIEYKGESHTLSEWSAITGINIKTIWWRLNTGWSVEDALELNPVIGTNQFSKKEKIDGK